MQDDLAGKALFPLADLVSAADFPLSAVIADQTRYAALFARFYYSDVDFYFQDGAATADVELIVEGALAIPVPGLDDCQLRFLSPIPGWTRLRGSLMLGAAPLCTIHEASITLELPSSILSDLAAGGRASVNLSSGISISSSGLNLVNVAGATLPPSRLVGTDIVVQARGVRPLLGQGGTDGVLPAMTGVEFDQLSLEIPLSFIALADQTRLIFDTDAARIDASGFSGSLHVSAQDFPTVLGGRCLALPFEFRQLHFDVEANRLDAFSIAIALRLPALEERDTPAWMSVTIDLDRNNRVLTAGLEAPLILGLGRGDFRLVIDTLTMYGRYGDDSFDLSGTVGGTLTLPSASILLEGAQIEFQHSAMETRLAVTVNGMALGALGAVDVARLVVVASNGDGDTGALQSVTIETVLRWAELRDRIAPGTLPIGFPLPPDDASIGVLFDWHEDGSIKMRLTAALSDLDALLSFVPPSYRPQVRNVSFQLAFNYASGDELSAAASDGAFDAQAAIEFELRLPALPEVPGADLFVYERTWIGASLKGRLSTDDGNGQAGMSLTFADAPPLGVNLPGLPQAEPPIAIRVDSVAFELQSADAGHSSAGSLRLRGGFELLPIDPATSLLPLPPAMAAHMAKLFKAVASHRFAGSVDLQLAFAQGNCMASLTGSFEDAGVQLDLFDLLSAAARGIAPPGGMSGELAAIDLDLDLDIRLREIRLRLGSLAQEQGPLELKLALDATFGGVQLDACAIDLSDSAFSFGFGRLAVPIALPHFPVGLSDLNPLRDASGAWDYDHRWLQEERPRAIDAIATLKAQIESLKIALADDAANPSIAAELRRTRTALFLQSARQFLIGSILAVHQLVGAPNRALYQSLVEAYMALMDATLHRLSFDTRLDFVLQDVRFVLPFTDPSDIRVEGGARLAGFAPEDPLAPLGDLVFKLGLSAEYIYFNVEGGEPVPLPFFGHYSNEAGVEEAKVSVRFNHARIGYGYSKNALVVAFAGELKIAPALADDLNSVNAIGVGIRLPERSRLGFKLDLIPIVLGEVDFLLPLFEFDIDLRRAYSPGIADPAQCTPHWDGLQLIAPNIVRADFKRLRFAPFFGSLLAPNYNTSFDLMLGDALNGFTHVCDDYLVIVSASPSTAIPLLTDGVPFFDNLCTNVRVAGFGINFDLQRPFPSMSPLALFEIFGLLADPMMPIDPDGALANTIRATIRNARIALPPSIVRMFPEHGATLTREVEYTLNLATVIAIAQAVGGAAGRLLDEVRTATDEVGGLLQQFVAEPPSLTPAELLAMLPPELRRFELHGAFAGFDASATFVLIGPDEARAVLARRTIPVRPTAPLRNEPARLPALRAALPTPDPARGAIYPGTTTLPTSIRPNFTRSGPALFDPTDATSRLLDEAPFDAFDAAALEALPSASLASGGILVGARVRVWREQRFDFLGFVSSDGGFGMVSRLGIPPLSLAVAGIAVEMPLQVSGRLVLLGQARGADSRAQVMARTWAVWHPVPGVVELAAGSASQPIEATLHADGRFAVIGQGEVKLFGGAATVEGAVDISHTHCFVDGAFRYRPAFKLGNQFLIDLTLATAGRIGPADVFDFRGAGALKIIGRAFSSVRGRISNAGASIEAKLDGGAWNWNGIAVRNCTLAVAGEIVPAALGPPSFHLEGEATLRLFGNAGSKSRAEIAGRGGIHAEAGSVTQFVEGSLYWQGREWMAGRVELGMEGIAIEGRTAFALDLTPAQLPAGVQLASLYFKVDLAGSFKLTKSGGLEACGIEVDWSLAVTMPGIDQQFPIAMQKKRFDYVAPASTEVVDVDLLPLVDIDSALFLPLDKVTLPIPVVTVDQFTQYYWYWDSVAQPGHVTYKRVSIANSGASTDPRFPSGVGKTGDTDIAGKIASAFGMPAPPVKINVPTYGVSGWKYIKFSDQNVGLPDVKVPRIAASVPSSVPAHQKFPLFKLPTNFSASFTDGASLRKALKFNLFLTWKGGKLGLTVARNSVRKFTPFDRMFD